MSQSNRQIARAATLVMVLFAASRALGLVRQMVIGAQFGTSAELDAYFAASRLPEMIFLVVAGGALGSAFIPTFTVHLQREDHAAAWRLASAIITLVLIVMVAITLLTMLAAPWLVPTVVAPGLPPEQQALTLTLLRIMLLTPAIFGVSGVAMGALNAQQHFLLPALAPLIYNLSIIVGAWWLGPRIGATGLAVGTVAGAVLHLLVQVPGLARYRARLRPRLGLRDADVLEVGRLVAPRVLGVAIAQINFVVSNSLASLLGIGAVSALNYAWMLMLLPQGIFAQAVGTAAFPTFAAQVARGEVDQMRRTLASTLRTILFLTLPASVGLIVLSRPLVALFFERGAFEQSSTEAVAWALAIFALGLVGHSGIEVVARAFYALHDTWTPVWVGGLAMGLNVVLSFVLPSLFRSLGLPDHAGLALANSIAIVLELLWLMWLLARRLEGLDGRATAVLAAKSAVASLAMGAALVALQALLRDRGSLVVGAGGVGVGVAVYGLVAWGLRVDELRSLARFVRR